VWVGEGSSVVVHRCTLATSAVDGGTSAYHARVAFHNTAAATGAFTVAHNELGFSSQESTYSAARLQHETNSSGGIDLGYRLRRVKKQGIHGALRAHIAPMTLECLGRYCTTAPPRVWCHMGQLECEPAGCN
jgi:hypothetical protein